MSEGLRLTENSHWTEHVKDGSKNAMNASFCAAKIAVICGVGAEARSKPGHADEVSARILGSYPPWTFPSVAYPGLGSGNAPSHPHVTCILVSTPE